MDERRMMAVIESILFVSGEPVSTKRVSEILDLDYRLTKKLLYKMVDCFNFERRGLQIIMVDDMFQLSTRPEYKDYIEKFLGTDIKQELSQACLETLSIVAYKQPVTKSEIEKIRGVKSDYSVSILIKKNLIVEVDRLDAPGKPILYGTTQNFLKSFGLSNIDELPEL